MCVRNTNQLNRRNENSDRSFRVKVKYSAQNGLFYSRVVSQTHWEADNKLIRKNKVYQLKPTGK